MIWKKKKSPRKYFINRFVIWNPLFAILVKIKKCTLEVKRKNAKQAEQLDSLACYALSWYDCLPMPYHH